MKTYKGIPKKQYRIPRKVKKKLKRLGSSTSIKGTSKIRVVCFDNKWEYPDWKRYRFVINPQ